MTKENAIKLLKIKTARLANPDFDLERCKKQKRNKTHFFGGCLMKIGDRIKIVEMVGEPQYTGKVGVIEGIDSIGQLHGTWGGCAVQPDKDTVEIVKTCCICGKDFTGYGNNPEPVKSEGKCCDECNGKVVVPARLKLA